MSAVVTYLVTDTHQLPFLVTSIYSLRRWWQGDIRVYSWPNSKALLRAISEDKRLSIDTGHWEPATRTDKFYDYTLSKIGIAKSVDEDVSIHLWYNTLIRCDLSEIVNKSRIGFVATQNNSLKRTIDIPILESTLTPSEDGLAFSENLQEDINSQIFASSPKSPVLVDWENSFLSLKGSDRSDDTTLMMSVNKHLPLGNVTVLKGNWNCSPDITSSSTENINIWNFRNELNIDPNNGAVRLWHPIWETCRTTNIGNVNDWIDSVLPPKGFSFTGAW